MYIYKLSAIPQEKNLHFGGKADSLHRMIKAKLPVPEGYAIAAEAFENCVLSEDARKELSELIAMLPTKHTYAVRSSAIGEDGKEASFAGAYETLTDIKTANIMDAVKKVADSAKSERVSIYADNRSQVGGKIAVIIQRFISPQYAGVVFTADPISADRAVMAGNFVRGEGETLVSGSGSDGEFTINVLSSQYSGSDEIRPYAKRIMRLARKIETLYGCPQDIEWAVYGNKPYILQARPITTLFSNDKGRFIINDSLCGNLLLSKTNVGEIFLRPVSPVTYGMIENIGNTLGIPLISAVCGQLYLNISGLCSVLCSFGMSRERAYKTLSELAGGIPEGVDIPIYPYDKKILLRKIGGVIKSAFIKKKDKNEYGKDFVKHIPYIAGKICEDIRHADSTEELCMIWNERCEPFFTRTLSAIATSLSVKPLFQTREKIRKICSVELTDRLLSNCSGNGSIESLGTLLAVDDMINERITREEYIFRYGHRHTDEMELALPYPYEDPEFPDNVIREYKKSGIDAYELKKKQEKRFEEAVKEFSELYPKKTGWLKSTLEKYSNAVYCREIIRSDSLRLFCMLREFILKAGSLTGLDDDIFMLYIDEIVAYLKGEKTSADKIEERRRNYSAQLAMPNFPSIICGRFTPEEWQQSGGAGGFYKYGVTGTDEKADVIRGVAGSCGQAEGVARVLTSINQSGELQKGEILVIPAANIGWVKVFPKAAAIVTDIGAPLSHAVIVARELGIPAVVSCQNASGVLKTGDRIRVDGASGTVTIIERAVG